jgi:hypothetical protein
MKRVTLRGWSRLSAAVAITAGLVSMCPGATSAAAQVLQHDHWTSPERVPFDLLAGPLFPSVSCTEAHFCAVVDQAGVVHESTGGAGPWRTFTLPSAVVTVSCRSASQCLVADVRGDVASIRNGVATTLERIFSTSLRGPMGSRGIAVSCSPQAPQCVVARRDGSVAVVETDGSARVQKVLPPSHLGVEASCVGTWCMVASGTDELAILNGGHWDDIKPIGNFYPASLTCRSSQFCLAASGYSYKVAVWNGSRWKVSSLQAKSIPLLGCTKTGQCLAVDGLTNRVAVYSGDKWSQLRSLHLITKNTGLASGLSCAANWCSLFFSRGYKQTVTFTRT